MAKPGYIRSFAMSERFVVPVEFLLLLNPLELVASGKPYIDNCHWQETASTRFLVVDKNKKRIFATFKSDPCFSFHYIN